MTKGGGKGGGGQGRPSQGPAGNRPGGNQNAADQRQAKIQGWGCVTVITALVFGGILWGLYDEGVFDKKPPKDAPVFGPQQTGRLVEQLSTAADAQGVCYGWVIDSGRPDDIKQLTPSYPGTFRPHPPKHAPNQAVQAGAGQGAGQGAAASPAPRPAPTGTRPGPAGTRPPASAPTSTPTAPTRQTRAERRMAAENESDLRSLSLPGVEYGSNLGPGKDPRQIPAQCPKWVILEADYTYLESSKEFLSGSFEIKNSFDESFQEFRFERRLGQVGEDDIDGENGTARLRDIIGALPMLVAEEGLAPAVPAETAPPAAEPAANDRLTESSVTERGVWSVFGTLLLASAFLVLVVGAVRSLRRSGS